MAENHRRRLSLVCLLLRRQICSRIHRPLLQRLQQVFIIGDQCQLGPVVLSKNAAKAGLKMSLFDKLFNGKQTQHFTFILTGFIFLLIWSMIYHEYIELHFCGLDKDSTKNIEKRAKKENRN